MNVLLLYCGIFDCLDIYDQKSTGRTGLLRRALNRSCSSTKSSDMQFHKASQRNRASATAYKHLTQKNDYMALFILLVWPLGCF